MPIVKRYPEHFMGPKLRRKQATPYSEETIISSTAMEAFLQAQTKFLEQQQKYAEMEETRKAEIHLAQIKELEERQKLLKLQEEQSEEAIAKREESEKVKQKLKQADRLEKWHDGDQADAYLAKFETVLTECDVPKEQWRGRLVNWCMCVACCVLCTCELMYIMSCYYVLYHCIMFPSNLLECCMHVFLIFSVLFLVCLELSIKDASSSPCIRSCLVCNIFSYPSLCAYSPSNTGLVVTS